MLERENTGLVIVDIQGNLARTVADSEALISTCATLIKGAKALNLPIVWVEQNPDKLGRTVDELAGLLGDISPIPKFAFSACSEPAFCDAIARTKVSDWLVCGTEAHICVYQTSVQLMDMGYKVHLVQDCVSSRSIENRTLALNKLSTRGAEITCMEMCLYELSRDCRDPMFKDILRLVK